jgi:hypothetical protein
MDPEPSVIGGLVHSRQARTAFAMTIVLAIGLVVLFLIVPAIGRLTLVGSICVVAFLWWVTGGPKPWIWPYSGRRTASLWVRLIYCVLQVGHGVGRLLVAAVVVAATLAAIAAVASGFTLLFDYAANGHVHLSGYTEFFAHDMPRWLNWALHGHLGTKDVY